MSSTYFQSLRIKIMIYCYFLLAYSLMSVSAYSRKNFSVNNESATESSLQCSNTDTTVASTFISQNGRDEARRTQGSSARKRAKGPYYAIQAQLHQQLFGEKVDVELGQHPASGPPPRRIQPLQFPMQETPNEGDEDASDNDTLHQYPDGQALRSELFNNKSGVHFPPQEFIYRGHVMLNITQDHMQTAINAFAILLHGTVTDVQNLPSDYVLRSARTIAMMIITREKLSMLWTVLKGDRSTGEIKYEELEMYRPLFKYVNAREIGRLNLKDTKILNYIGTHADLDRHQVGVVASKYMQLNPKWSEVNYMNHMNNLLCGVPMNFMRKIPSDIYLQLSHQVFYHIRACDPLQRRFYLAMMTKTEALGKSYSWSARDVSRLGLLLAEVQGPDLAAINPESMSGITAQVMMEIPAHNLEYFTDIQVQYLALKPLTIFARKIKIFNDNLHSGRATRIPNSLLHDLLLVVLSFNLIHLK